LSKADNKFIPHCYDLALYALTRQCLVDDERLYLEIWSKRKAFVFFMVYLHGTIALLVKLVDDAEISAAAIAASIAAAEAGAMRRMLVRDQFWQRHCQPQQQRQLRSGFSYSRSNTSNNGSNSRNSGVVFVNSIRHQNNIEEVFTRWTIFYNITSFL